MEGNKKAPLAGRENLSGLYVVTNRVTPNGVSITAHVGNELSAAIRRKEMTLDLLLTQDQGSSIVDGINHLRNLLLSIDLFLGEFT